MKFNPINSLFTFVVTLIMCSCQVGNMKFAKDIVYTEKSTLNAIPECKLNIFTPKFADKNEVILFAYGGSWQSGKKEIYSFLGRRLARKGYVAVVIDYPLAPAYKIQQMSLAVAQAINWTSKHIESYGGDHKNIYVAGHSAGGHLVTLNTLNNRYFDSLKVTNPIRGVIMIDAAGIDMYEYLKSANIPSGTSYLQAFTNDPAVWKSHSPLYFLDKDDPNMLILLGGKTYPGIMSSTKKLLEKTNNMSISPTFHLQEGKKHVSMIGQFFWPWSKTYKWIQEFTEKTSI